MGEKDPSLITSGKFLSLFRTHTAKYLAFTACLVSSATFSYCKSLYFKIRFNTPLRVLIFIDYSRDYSFARSSKQFTNKNTARSVGQLYSERSPCARGFKSGGLFPITEITLGGILPKPHIPFLSSRAPLRFLFPLRGTDLSYLPAQKERS